MAFFVYWHCLLSLPGNIEREVDRNIKEPSQQLSSSSRPGSRMASEQPEFTLTEIVAGDQSQYLSDTEKSAKKPGHKRRQNKSSKNRNKRKAKKEEEEYRKFMEELAVSVDARHREFGVKALLDLSGISRQGNHYEPFIVDSTNPRSTIQWQAGPGGFNSQYTGDTGRCI